MSDPIEANRFFEFDQKISKELSICLKCKKEYCECGLLEKENHDD